MKNAKRIFTSDLESDASPALLIFIGMLLALASTAIGAVAGFEYRDRLQREYDAQKKYRPRPVVQNPPPPLINCADPIRSREEVSRICRARWRSAQVGGK